MKNLILISMMLLMSSLSTKASQSDSLTLKNYWVIEKNTSASPFTKIHFYSPDHVHLREIHVAGSKINISRKSVIRRLNKLACNANVATIDKSEIASILKLTPSCINESYKTCTTS